MNQRRKEVIETGIAKHSVWQTGWLNDITLKDSIMNTARILSIATVAAFASFGAQAGALDNSNAGDVYGYGFDTASQTSSTVQRATVRNEGAAALPTQMNNPVFNVKAMSNVSRDAVRAEAVMAVRNGDLATGNQS